MAQPNANDILREPAERQFAIQLAALAANDKDAPPNAWRLSPRSVLAYIVGTAKPLKLTIDGKVTEVAITRKFFGDDAIVERAIVTLASERALLLVGEPGTGKSWLSEHLAAAISGCSTLTIQGTAGTTEDQVKYSWNIARVIAHGPTPDNMITASSAARSTCCARIGSRSTPSATTRSWSAWFAASGAPAASTRAGSPSKATTAAPPPI